MILLRNMVAYAKFSGASLMILLIEMMVTAHKISDLNPVNSKLMQIPPKNWSFLYPDANFSIPR